MVDSAKTRPCLSTNPSIYSNRVSAVSPASVALFRGTVFINSSINDSSYLSDLGVWNRLEKYRVKQVNKLHVRFYFFLMICNDQIQVIESASRAEITFDRPGNAEVVIPLVLHFTTFYDLFRLPSLLRMML